MTVVTLRPGSQGPLAHDPDAPQPEGAWDVRVWSKDKHAYHNDGMATVIPHAEDGKGGGSLGFAAGSGVVQVGANPVTGEGGTPIDMSRVSAAKSAQAYAEASAQGGSRAEKIEHAFRMMGVAVDQLPPEPVTPAYNPLVSSDDYVTPTASLDGGQLNQGTPMPTHPPPRVGHSPASSPVAPPVPVANQQAITPAAAPITLGPPPSADNRQLIDMLVQQGQQTQQMMQMMMTTMQNSVPAADVKVAGRLPEPAPEPEADMATRTENEIMMEQASLQKDLDIDKVVDERTYTRENVYDVVRQSFESLSIPGLGPEAQKPTYLVNFDMGNMGQLSVRYHWVGQHERGLFLIYDRRYEYGTEYIPPALKEPFRVSCPDQGKSFMVRNPGFTHPFGKLLIINLIIQADEASQVPDAEADYTAPMQLSGGTSTEMDVTKPVTVETMLQGMA